MQAARCISHCRPLSFILSVCFLWFLCVFSCGFFFVFLVLFPSEFVSVCFRLFLFVLIVCVCAVISSSDLLYPVQIAVETGGPMGSSAISPGVEDIRKTPIPQLFNAQAEPTTRQGIRNQTIWRDKKRDSSNPILLENGTRRFP